MERSDVADADAYHATSDGPVPLFITLAQARCLRSALREAVTHLWDAHPDARARAIDTYRSLPRDMTRLDSGWPGQSGMRPTSSPHNDGTHVLEVLPEYRRLYRAALATSVAYFSASCEVLPRLCATPAEARSLLAILDGAFAGPSEPIEHPVGLAHGTSLRHGSTLAPRVVATPVRHIAHPADPEDWVTGIWGEAAAAAT